MTQIARRYWADAGVASKIANAFLTAVFPIVLNTIMGLTNMDPELLELAHRVEIVCAHDREHRCASFH